MDTMAGGAAHARTVTVGTALHDVRTERQYLRLAQAVPRPM
jgi:hypothetical protein